MTVLEFALPNLIKNAALVEESAKKVFPGFQVKLQEAGAINGLRGFWETENGRDVRNDFRLALVLEWPTTQHFKNFITSPPYAEFGSQIKKYAAGPPELKIFEDGSDVTPLFQTGKHVLEYIVVKPKDSSEAGVQSALQTLRDRISQLGSSRAAVRISSNLPVREIAVVSLYGSHADLETAKATPARKQLLADIANIAELTTLVASVEKVIPVTSN